MNITVRNIPDEIITRLKTLSLLEKRSINSEILIILEKGLEEEIDSLSKEKNDISKETQVQIWEKLSGQWEDDRTTSEIIEDIIGKRSAGRNIIL